MKRTNQNVRTNWNPREDLRRAINEELPRLRKEAKKEHSLYFEDYDQKNLDKIDCQGNEYEPREYNEDDYEEVVKCKDKIGELEKWVRGLEEMGTKEFIQFAGEMGLLVLMRKKNVINK